MSKQTLSLLECASILGIGRDLVYAAAGLGHIPTIPIGRRKYVPVPALEKLLGGTVRIPETAVRHRRSRKEGAPM
jgi:hypothetical protein